MHHSYSIALIHGEPITIHYFNIRYVESMLDIRKALYPAWYKK